MALGDYLSTKSEIDFYKKERIREKWEIDHCPEGEKFEIFEIFYNKVSRTIFYCFFFYRFLNLLK